MNDATKKAIQSAGSQKGLADELKLTQQAVQKWLKTGVPAERVIEVETVTGVSRYDLRPDVFGEPPEKLSA